MDVGDMPEFKNPEAGEYEANIVKADLTNTKKGDPMLVLQVKLVSEDPDINGSKYKYYHVLPNKKNEYYDMQLKSSRALCENLGIEGDPDPEDFENLDCRVLLQIDNLDNGEFPSIKRILAA